VAARDDTDDTGADRADGKGVPLPRGPPWRPQPHRERSSVQSSV